MRPKRLSSCRCPCCCCCCTGVITTGGAGWVGQYFVLPSLEVQGRMGQYFVLLVETYLLLHRLLQVEPGISCSCVAACIGGALPWLMPLFWLPLHHGLSLRGWPYGANPRLHGQDQSISSAGQCHWPLAARGCLISNVLCCRMHCCGALNPLRLPHLKCLLCYVCYVIEPAR